MLYFCGIIRLIRIEVVIPQAGLLEMCAAGRKSFDWSFLHDMTCHTQQRADI